MSIKIALTGRNGQVATALAEVGPNLGVTIVRLGRPELDLTRPETVRPVLEAARADVVVNAAAFTSVDKAEGEPELARAVNARGAGAVAQAAAELDLPILHLSTDYVFDGANKRPYREGDSTGPLGVYGRTKLEGEQAVAAATARHLILRTAWVYAPFGNNFVRTMLRVGATRSEVAVVADQRGCPTSALDIAVALIAVARRVATAHPMAGNPGFGAGSPSEDAQRPDSMFSEAGQPPDAYGTFHLVGQGEASWADLAEAIFAYSAELGGPVARVKRITTTDYPTVARRPANSRLDGAKLAGTYDILLPNWRDSLKTCVTRLLTGPNLGQAGSELSRLDGNGA